MKKTFILMSCFLFFACAAVKGETAAADAQDEKGAWEYIDEGNSAFDAKDADAARENFKKALSSPDVDKGARAKALFMLGETEYNYGKPQEAERYYRDCIKADPETGDAYEALAYLYFYQKKYDSSLSVIGAAETNEASNGNLTAVKALDYASIGKFREAEDAASGYGRSFNFVKGQKDFVWAYVLLKEKKYKMALDRFGYAEEGYENDPFFYYNYALARQADGDIKGALAHIKRSLALEPGNTDYKALQGELDKGTGE